MIKSGDRLFKGRIAVPCHDRGAPPPRHYNPRVLRLTCLLLAAALAAPATQARDLPQLVAKALREASVPQANVAIVVQELGARFPALSHNAGVPMNPASTMKLVTTFAALDLLGPAYHWKTEAYAAGELRDGVLQGDLILKGYGDPKLDYESFWMLLRALRGRGLREIRGDLVLDRSFFAPRAADANRFDGEGLRPYNVLPDALLVHYKSLRFAFVPEPPREAVRIYVEPRPPGLEVANTLRLSGGNCLEGRAFRDMLQADFTAGPPPRAAFSGRYPIACGEKELNVALLPPNDQVAGVLRELWPEMGGKWNGQVREGEVPADALLLHTHPSAPLSEIVRYINKYSNNVMARQLYLTLATASSEPPARAELAGETVRHWLALKDIPAPELVIENGSGLSRTDRISAASLAALLQAAWKSAVMPEFVSSLSLVAFDGTMRKRLQADPVAGQAHIKTGLLSDVRALAGYVLDKKGRRKVVVMLMNHPNAPEAEAATDEILRWAYER
jgi:D-alanyl-D-alanine carboxypeptidase/D-alanyl-D-alanine-endopeptidase (penicillin-binding protein 4)